MMHTVLEVHNDAGSFEIPGAGGLTVHGNHGSLVIYANGDYTYTPNADAAGIGTNDVFTYELHHPTGFVETAQLTITIAQSVSASISTMSLDISDSPDVAVHAGSEAAAQHEGDADASDHDEQLAAEHAADQPLDLIHADTDVVPLPGEDQMTAGAATGNAGTGPTEALVLEEGGGTVELAAADESTPSESGDSSASANGSNEAAAVSTDTDMTPDYPLDYLVPMLPEEQQPLHAV